MLVGNRILIIEDEPAIAETIRYALAAEGFDPVSCATAAAGFKTFATASPSLVVLDIGLPDESGIEVCRKLRQVSEIPILFLSARSTEIDRVVGLEIGADDYLTKPFSPRELVARVRAILRRSAAAKPNPTALAHSSEVGSPTVPPRAATAPAPSKAPFEVDEARHLILYRGKPLELSRYEFKVLAILLANPGWVFSREKLMDRVWDVPDSSMERTVDTHIKNIRAQIRKITPELDPIITHRGIGYALREEW